MHWTASTVCNRNEQWAPQALIFMAVFAVKSCGRDRRTMRSDALDQLKGCLKLWMAKSYGSPPHCYASWHWCYNSRQAKREESPRSLDDIEWHLWPLQHLRYHNNNSLDHPITTLRQYSEWCWVAGLSAKNIDNSVLRPPYHWHYRYRWALESRGHRIDLSTFILSQHLHSSADLQVVLCLNCAWLKMCCWGSYCIQSKKQYKVFSNNPCMLSCIP